MLISFEVENFLSLKDRQELSMIAGSDKEMETTHCFLPDPTADLRLLKAAALYGANASGKSNVIKAILYMRDIILTSTSSERISEDMGFQPFKLDRNSHQQPGFFEIKFSIEKEIYTYGFIIDDKKIISEWLHFYPHQTKALLFHRDLHQGSESDDKAEPKKYKYGYKFGSYFKGEKNKIKSLTRANALYLTVGAQFAHPILEKIFAWFSDYLKPVITTGTGKINDFTTELMEKNVAMKKRIVTFLKSADLGIEDVKIEKLKKEVKKGKTPGIKMIHRAIAHNNGNEVLADIDFNNESMGTRRMFQLAGPLFHTLVNGGILIIDELEDSLHFHMLNVLLSEFFKNSSQSQIIFTTHNVQLLEDKLFRRDEIWFTEKRADGATELFSLADFKPKPRKDKSLKNGYLNGAFGAVPVLGDILSE